MAAGRVHLIVDEARRIDERAKREGLDIDQLVYDELRRLAGNRP